MENNDKSVQQQITCELPDTTHASHETGVNELSPLEDTSVSSNRNGHVTSSNERHPQPCDLFAESPRKRGRPPNMPVELRYDQLFSSFSYSLFSKLISEEGRNVLRTLGRMNIE